MVTCLQKICCLWLLLAWSNIAVAQKDIVISDSLAAHAQKLNVKLGAQWFGKIWKIRFGEYAVVSSKMAWTPMTTRGNFFNTRTESKSTEKFSFVLTNKSNDSAKVNAANNILIEAMHEIEILPNFTWGDNELIQEQRNFSAFININQDTTETWALFMNFIRGKNIEGSSESFLTNGRRTIFVVPTTSYKNGEDKRPMPAMGYEFIENNQSLGALQYYGGGLMGMNKNVVWIHDGLEERLKLVLAAACTAILQIKANK